MTNREKGNCPDETFCFNCPSCGDIIEINLVLGEKRSCPCGVEFQVFQQDGSFLFLKKNSLFEKNRKEEEKRILVFRKKVQKSIQIFTRII